MAEIAALAMSCNILQYLAISILQLHLHTVRHVVDTPPPIEIGSITAEEVREAIRTSTPNKAPGPDGLVIELYKFLDEDNVDTFAKILNQMWTEESYPADLLARK